MAWRDERPGVQLRLPLLPAIALSGRDRERLDLPVLGRCRERCASGVGRPPRPQDLESAGSTRVVTCAPFPPLPRSDFLHLPPLLTTKDAVLQSPPPTLPTPASPLN